MTIDVNKLIADEKAARAIADAKKVAADKAAAALKASNKANANFKLQAENKLGYANALQQTIADYEGQLQTFAMQIARDGKLDPVQQREFDRIVKDYSKVSKTYDATVKEADAILASAPSPTKVETQGGKAGIGATAEQRTVDALNGRLVPGAEAGTGSVATVESVVKDLDAKIKDARQFVYDMKPEARKVLAQELTDSGIKTNNFNGKFNPNLVNNYIALLNQAKIYNTQNKGITGFAPLGFAEFTKYQKDLVASGGGAGQAQSYTNANIYADATSFINDRFKSTLGRDATPKEIADLTAKLTAAQRKKPDQISVDANGNRTTIQGLDSQGFIDDQLKKLPEFAAKLKEKTASKVEPLINTARANGILFDQNQIDTWNNRIKNGEDPAAIQTEIRSMAANGRPDSIAKQLLGGNDLTTILSPYKNYMQQVLEIPAEQIDLHDPTLQMAINGDKPMNLYDYQKALRKDDRWQYTDNAKATVSDSVQKVLKDFGFMG